MGMTYPRVPSSRRRQQTDQRGRIAKRRIYYQRRVRGYAWLSRRNKPVREDFRCREVPTILSTACWHLQSLRRKDGLTTSLEAPTSSRSEGLAANVFRGCEEEKEQVERAFRCRCGIGGPRGDAGRSLRGTTAACRWLAAAQRKIHTRDESIANVGISGRSRQAGSSSSSGAVRAGRDRYLLSYFQISEQLLLHTRYLLKQFSDIYKY